MLLQQPTRRKLIISLTPLIDVVFILLIFFMLASNFVTTTEYEVTTHTGAGLEDTQVNTLLIHVNSDGECFLNGEAIHLDKLRVALLRSEVGAKAQKKSSQVVVDMAASATLQQGLDVYDIALSAGLPVKLSPQAAP